MIMITVILVVLMMILRLAIMIETRRRKANDFTETKLKSNCLISATNLKEHASISWKTKTNKLCPSGGRHGAS